MGTRDRAPLIGVTTGFTDYGDYLGVACTRPLAALHAVPVVVPYVESDAARSELLSRLDGLLLGYGRDIEPHRYGGEPHPSSTQHSPLRDESELALARAAIDAGVPILGICRGMQIINVARGGSLIADHSLNEGEAAEHLGGDWDRWDEVVEATLGGTPSPPHPSHAITIAAGSRLSEALGEAADVNSYHHQALDRLGDGVTAVAWAPDGVVEAIEIPDAAALCLGVQWELQEGWHTSTDEHGVFALLVEAARTRI